MTPRNAARMTKNFGGKTRKICVGWWRRGITPYPSSSVPRGFLLYLRTTPEGGRWEEPLQYSRNTAERYWLDLYAYNDCNTLCCRFAALLLVFCLFLNRLVFYPSLVWRKEDAIDLHVDIR